jgi:hypothetical protein
VSGSDGLDDPEVALVASLERLLLQPAARRDPEVLERLLAPDFREVGASGRAWTREAVVADLLAVDGPLGPPIADHHLRGTRLAPDVVLLELVTDNAGRWARRHSLWRRRHDGQWQTFLHQGTRTDPDPDPDPEV